MPTEQTKLAGEIVEQYNESARWIQKNYFNEFSEIYRSVKCRASTTDAAGKEIKGNRTNVVMPDHFVMRRKKVARLTAQTPNLRIRGGQEQTERDKLSALMYRQWDIGGWQRVFRQMVDQCAILGWSVSKTSWSKVTNLRSLRRATTRLNRPQLLLLKGAPPDEILAAEQEPQLSEVEINSALAEFGPEVALKLPITKYEGPVGERIFIGDIFPESGFKSLKQSSFVIEYGERDAAWLKYWSEVKGFNPDTGEYGPVFDPKAIESLMKDSGNNYTSTNREIDLRKQMREAVRVSDPQLDSRLRGKRYCILERHSVTDEGKFRIDWCDDTGKNYLGAMFYPWDTYGNYIYNELVLIPDLLGGIGESTIRASRFLIQLKNTRYNQTTDFLNRLLRPKIKKLDTCEVKEESYERDAFTEIEVSDMNGMEPFVDPRFPSEAFLDAQMLNREIQQAEPLINDFSPGSDAIPNSGRLATTAVFQQKSADSIVNDELKQIDLWLYDVLNLNLAMTQQLMQQTVEVERGVHERVDGLSLMSDQNARSIQIEPLEIQHDMEIFPETGSTLAADDEFKAGRILQGYALAKQDPLNFNVKAFAKKVVSVMPGMSVAEAIMPDVEKEQMPEVKVSVSVNFKDLASDAKAWMLSKIGAPVAGTQATAALESVNKLSESAESAVNLESSMDSKPKPNGDSSNG